MLELFTTAFVTFFVVIDPPGVAPMFAALTDNTSREWQRKMAFKAVFVATVIMVGFAFGGAWLLEHLGVTLDAFRIAGGGMLFLIAIDMLFEKRNERREDRNEKVLDNAKKHPERFEDVSVFPLGIPLLAGPGSIATVMLYFSQHKAFLSKMVVLGSVGLNLFLCLIVFLLAPKITKFIGPTIATALERILGIILAALSAQFVIDGIKGAFSL